MSIEIYCKDLLEDKNWIVKTIFIILQNYSDNSLNFAFFYNYYWTIRSKFLLYAESEIRVHEAFDSIRSILIKDTEKLN